jgi:ABC-type multidrug transport system ATPase subunit
MKILLSDAGKRFNREWIFRHANLQLEKGHAYAITGPNGSGKSTLLQTIGGLLQPSEGEIIYTINGSQVAQEKVFSHISFCAPYLDVIEEMTLTEFLRFHFSFKTMLPGLSIEEMITLTGLSAAADKQIRNYSSGMKQRVKLAQAILSDTEVLLLDEPCTNLDATGIELYHSMIEGYGKGRLIIVSSNDEVEYRFCQTIIPIQSLRN